MPVRFAKRPSEPTTFPVLEVKLNAPQFVVVGHGTNAHVVKDLHWLPAQGRSVPGLDEDCPWHHLPVREVLFAPCLWDAGRQWKIGVMPFSRKMLVFLDGNYAGKIFKFFRAESFNAPIRWTYMESMRPCNVPVPDVDVVPSLLRMWGAYCNYKIPGPRLLDDQGGLFQEGRAS